MGQLLKQINESTKVVSSAHIHTLNHLNHRNLGGGNQHIIKLTNQRINE